MVCMYVCMHACMYKYMHACMYACMHVCMIALNVWYGMVCNVFLRFAIGCWIWRCKGLRRSFTTRVLMTFLRSIGIAGARCHHVSPKSGLWEWASRALEVANNKKILYLQLCQLRHQDIRIRHVQAEFSGRNWCWAMLGCSFSLSNSIQLIWGEIHRKPWFLHYE